ncbi:MAG: hypothetical protein L6R35_005017, partial [Caloplaca aegaea]
MAPSNLFRVSSFYPPPSATNSTLSRPTPSDTYQIHHNESTFPRFHTYDPARWLGSPKGPDRSKQLLRYIVAFSKGARVCLGMQLACAGLHDVLATAATLVTASPIHRIKGGSDSHSSMNAGYPGIVFLTEFPTVSSLPAVHTHAPRKEAQLIPPTALTATFDVGPGPVVHSSIAASTSTVASPKATTFTTNTVFSTRTVTLPSTTSANLNAPSTVAVLPTGTFVLPPSRPKDPPHLRPTCRVPDAGYPPPIGGCYPGCDKNGDGFCGAADEAGLYPPIIPYPLHTATLPARAAVNTAAPLAKREGGKDVLLAFGRMAGLEPDLIDGPPHTAPPSPPVEKRQDGEDDWKALKLGFGPSVPITRPSSRPHGKPDGLVGVKPTPINALPPAAPVPKPPHGIAAVQPTPINVLPPAAT